MAGRSSRFYKAGYTQPKFMLPLGDNSNVFRESILSFEKYFHKDNFLFITRIDDGSKAFVEKECEQLGITNFQIVSVEFETRGQADSVALGLKRAKIENILDSLYIFNIDSIRREFTKPSQEFLFGTAGFLEVFKGEGKHWSFAEPAENNLVKRTTEKIRISDLCSNGLYYFSTIKCFQDAFGKLENLKDYNELFIAPMFNLLLEDGHQVKYRLLNNDQTLFSGIPAEYEHLKNSFIVSN